MIKIKLYKKIFKQKLFIKKNKELLIDNHLWSYNHYDNKLNFYYFIIQKLIKNGHRLKSHKIIFKVLNSIFLYSRFLVKKLYLLTGKKIRRKILRKLKFPLKYKFMLTEHYKNKFPAFSVRLVNEYKGKHRTKKKLLKPFFIERENARIFELITWLKRISFRYRYRSFYLRFCLILFNFLFLFNTKSDKLKPIFNNLSSLKKNKQKIYVQTDKEAKATRYYKKVLWQLTLDRLRIRILPLFDRYYKRLCLKYYKTPSYIHNHMIKKKSLKRYWSMLVREKRLKWADIAKSEMDNNL